MRTERDAVLGCQHRGSYRRHVDLQRVASAVCPA
ncbi:putative leader peptide [Actinomycetospora termitidis]